MTRAWRQPEVRRGLCPPVSATWAAPCGTPLTGVNLTILIVDLRRGATEGAKRGHLVPAERLRAIRSHLFPLVASLVVAVGVPRNA